MAHLWHSGFIHTVISNRGALCESTATHASDIYHSFTPFVGELHFPCSGWPFKTLGMAHPHSEVKSRQQQHPAVELFFSCCQMTRITKDKENEDCSSLCQTGLARSSPNNSSNLLKEWLCSAEGWGTIGSTTWNRGSSTQTHSSTLWIMGLLLKPGRDITAVLRSLIYAFQPSWMSP